MSQLSKKSRLLTFFTVIMAVPLTLVFCSLLWDNGELTPGLTVVFALICGLCGRLFAVVMVKLIESTYGPID